MEEFVVFSEQVAQGLIEKGFELLREKRGLYYFIDSLLLEKEIEKLLENFVKRA